VCPPPPSQQAAPTLRNGLRIENTPRYHVHFAIGWSLKDPNVWAHLAEQRVVKKPAKNRLVRRDDGFFSLVEVRPERWVRLPIQRYPINDGAMWTKILRHVYKQFRPWLAEAGEDDPWVSYSLSYEALVRCADVGKHREFSYVYTACKNAHRRYLSRLEAQARRPDPEHREPSSDELANDLRLDFEEAVRAMPARDARIVRLRLLEERTFEDIGQELGGLERSTVKRLFDSCLLRLRAALADYAE
jgi:RNA polymerase sigma factor (sigma-70 family)